MRNNLSSDRAKAVDILADSFKELGAVLHGLIEDETVRVEKKYGVRIFRPVGIDEIIEIERELRVKAP